VSTPAATPTAGTRLGGRYVLLDWLGNGGMGVVWRARDELIGREVAIKDLTLPPSATAADQAGLRARVVREARVAARFSHPGAVVLHDVLEHDGRPFLVMELVDAPTLHALVQRDGPLPPGRVAGLGLRLLDTLVAAHRQGVVHLDVTPANVLVLADGGTKLADFGIAAVQGAPLDGGGLVVGSPGYMAPEQVVGDQVGPPADLWALAATMYFAVEGMPPFSQGEPRVVLESVVDDAPRPPRRAGELAPALLGVLVKDPARRSGAERLREQLHRVAAAGDGARPWPARPAGTGAGEGPGGAGAPVTVGAERVPEEPGGLGGAGAPPAAGMTLPLPAGQPRTDWQQPNPYRWPGAPVRLWLVLAGVLLLLLGVVAVQDRGDQPGTRAVPGPPAGTAPPRAAAAVPANDGFVVRHRPDALSADDNSIRPALEIVNTGGAAVPLRELTIRYWYTVDGWRPQQVWCDWASFGNGNVLGRTVRLPRQVEGADSYVEIRFADGAGQLAAGSSSELKARFNKADWSSFHQRDDWSWAAPVRYAAAPHITLYRNGRLVWGSEPPGA